MQLFTLAKVNRYTENDARQPLLTVVVVGRNRVEKLSKCIESIKSNTIPSRIIYVDTGSNSNVISLIREKYSDLEIVCINSGNPQQGRNIGARMSSSEFVLFSDDDIVYPSNAFEAGITVLSTNANIGVVGWDTSGVSSSRVVGYTFGTPIFLTRDGHSSRKVGSINVFTVRNAYLMRKHIWTEVGGWWEFLFIQFDENDILYRTQRLGYGVACLMQPTITDLELSRSHKESRVIQELGVSRNVLGARNYLLVTLSNLSILSLCFILPTSLLFLLLDGFRFRRVGQVLHGLKLGLADIGRALARRESFKPSFKVDLKILNQSYGSIVDTK